MLYFLYSTWQGNDLSVIRNFLAITKHTSCADYTLIYHIKSGRTHYVVMFTILSIAVSAKENRLKSFQFFATCASGSVLLQYSMFTPCGAI